MKYDKYIFVKTSTVSIHLKNYSKWQNLTPLSVEEASLHFLSELFIGEDRKV